MAAIQDTVFCDGCGIEVTWTPYYLNPTHNQPGVRRSEFCCQVSGMRSTRPWHVSHPTPLLT